MRSSKGQAAFNVSISQLEKTSYQIKSPEQRLYGMVWEQRSQYWQTPHLGTKLYSYELVFHAHIEENSAGNLCFIKKHILSS